MTESLEKVYGNRLRLRVCGILQRNSKLLLVRHSFGKKGELWMPPGGEVLFGEPAKEALKREFLEETGLEVKVGSLAFVYEYINSPYHALELFYKIDSFSGEIIRGSDPETQTQIIEEVRFVTFDELRVMDKQVLHGIFTLAEDPEKVHDLTGFYEAPPL